MYEIKNPEEEPSKHVELTETQYLQQNPLESDEKRVPTPEELEQAKVANAEAKPEPDAEEETAPEAEPVKEGAKATDADVKPAPKSAPGSSDKPATKEK